MERLRAAAAQFCGKNVMPLQDDETLFFTGNLNAAIVEFPQLTGIVILGFGQGQTHGQQSLGVDIPLAIEQPSQALDHQAGATQHYQRQRYFRRHQNVTETVPAAGAGGASAFLKRLVHVAAQSAEGRSDAEK